MGRRRSFIIGLSRKVLRRSRAGWPRLRRAARRQMSLLLTTPAIVRAHRLVSRRIRELAGQRIIRAAWMAIEPLELRVMFSSIGPPSNHVDDAERQCNFLASIYQVSAPPMKTETSVSGASGQLLPRPRQTRTPHAANVGSTTGPAEQTQNVVLLDSNLKDSGQLAQAIVPGAKTFVYNGATESANTVLAQVVQWARAGNVRIGSLTILSHGHAGAFELGDQWVSNTSLAQTAGEWRKLAHWFAADASVDVFGCDVAAPGSDGQVLIARLANLTGSAVFASDNLTGRGGDWTLEVASTGRRPIAAPVAPAPLDEQQLAAYDGTLITYTVTTTSDSGPGSLRQAITDANTDGGADTIAFSIPGAGVHTIIPSSALPAVSDTVTIDGTTQPGYAGAPLIELDGANAGAGVDGLLLTGGDATVRGLIINHFSGDGIHITAAGGDIVTGNYIGTDAIGATALGNSGDGVEVQSPGNTIGGTFAGAGNVISGNTSNGLSINGASAVGNLVEGNLIGVDAAGAAAIPNAIGLVLSGASSNTIGGTTAAARNVISGNTSRGIEILSGGSGNQLTGNYIGVDASGSNALSDDLGVLIVDSSGNTIGGIASGAGNVISGNAAGIDLFGSSTTGNTVEGNYIGTDSSGAVAVPNQTGVIIVAGAGGNTIGGLAAGAGNVISGNSSVGVYFNNGASGNFVEGNSIGISATGAALGNLTGVYADGTSGAAVQGNTIGGTLAGAGNVIAYSQQDGVVVVGSGAFGTAILGNSMYGNAPLGIDLGMDGVTPDSGTTSSSLPNNGMNFPVITSTTLSGSTLSVAGYVGSAANQAAFANARVEIFQTDSNAAGNGQGKTYLGFLTADSNGNFSGTLSVSGVVRGDYLTATATDASGNTSEFAGNFNTNVAPTVATAASAAPNPVTGLTTLLSVLGADDGGESNLTYTWAAISGPAAVAFSDNGDNTAKSSTATFTQAGAYQLQATITDSEGLSTVGNIVNVTVNPTFTSISIPSQPPAMADNTTYPYAATALDQFGNPLATQPAMTWSVTGGAGGTIGNTGIYSTPASSTGTDTIHVSSGGISATAPVTVTGDGIFSGGVDVGPPNVPGYFSYNAGTYSVTGGDNNNSATNDQFQFPNTTYTGDTTLVAEVTNTNGTSSPACAGLIFRDSTASNAPFAGILLYPGNNLYFQARNVAGAGNSSAQAGGSFSAPVWLKLVRSGNNFSGYYSTDGVNWTQVGASVTYSDPNSILGGLFVTSFNVHTVSTATFTNVGQLSVAAPAAASPNPVTGTSASLSALGAYTAGESNLTYTWSATGTPPAPVTFLNNGDNSAKDTTANFTQAGVYNLLVTISDGADTVTSPVTVTVNPTLTSIAVTPATPALNENGTQQFAAVANDQFGNALATQPAINWGIAGGGIGGVSANGLYTAPAASGAATVTASNGGVSGSATVTVTNAAPTVVTHAAASPSPVTGTTTNLSVLGADDGGEPNLTYTWAATGEPPGAHPLFSDNGDNSAKSSTVTFDKAGPYTFTCTISDGQGGTVASSTSVVTVDQTLTGITVTPASTDVDINGTQQFTATGLDQFGHALSTQPTFAWTNSGAGSIGASGMYAAPGSAGSDTITASSGGLTGSATAMITDGVPSVATLASVSVSLTTAALSVLGADDGGESHLTYAWSTIGGSPAGVTFSDTGDNSAKNVTATFTQSGTYDFQVTITNPLGLITTSSITATVDQTLGSIIVSPANANIHENSAQQFTATGDDQFGDAMSPQPAFDWTSSIGSIGSGSGDFTSADTSGAGTVTASSGGISGSQNITVTNAAPTVAIRAHATPTPVTGTTMTLSVLGADDGGESNLTYTWAALAKPLGSNPQFSANGANSAKDSTVTFDEPGNYTFFCTINDGQGGTVTTSVNVAVERTLSSISVTPTSSALYENETRSLSAVGFDQFGVALASQPVFSWSTTGIGSVNSAGHYTAPDNAGTATIYATSGSVNGSAIVSVTNAAPTVAIAASATPNPVTGTTTILSVLGADDGGESNLSYKWFTTARPTNAFPVFSVNGTNSAQNSTVTFDRAGDYTFTCSISDGQGGVVTSSVNLMVIQTLSGLTITASAGRSVAPRGEVLLTALQFDQFGLQMDQQLPVTWSLQSGGGTISSDGVFVASAEAGRAVVGATAGGLADTIAVAVDKTTPLMVIPPTPQQTFVTPASPASGDGGSATLTPDGDSGGGGHTPFDPASQPVSKNLTAWLQEKSVVVVAPVVKVVVVPDGRALPVAPPRPAIRQAAPVSPTTAPNQLVAADLPTQSGTVVIGPINRTEILRELDLAQSDRWDQGAADEARLKLRVGLASAIGSTAASAYLLWLVRGGGVLASLLSSAPAWRLVDPFFVLPSRPFYRAFWSRRKKKEYEHPEDRFFGKNRRG